MRTDNQNYIRFIRKLDQVVKEEYKQRWSTIMEWVRHGDPLKQLYQEPFFRARVFELPKTYTNPIRQWINHLLCWFSDKIHRIPLLLNLNIYRLQIYSIYQSIIGIFIIGIIGYFIQRYWLSHVNFLSPFPFVKWMLFFSSMYLLKIVPRSFVQHVEQNHSFPKDSFAATRIIPFIKIMQTNKFSNFNYLSSIVGFLLNISIIAYSSYQSIMLDYDIRQKLDHSLERLQHICHIRDHLKGVGVELSVKIDLRQTDVDNRGRLLKRVCVSPQIQGWNELVEEIQEKYKCWELAIDERYNFTQISDDKQIVIKGLIPSTTSSNYQKNDIFIKNGIILTGKNASGKSTLCKSVVECMCDSLKYGVAKATSCTHPWYDEIVYYIPPKTDQTGEVSLFEHEIIDIHEIHRRSEKGQIFVVMDEIFSSTMGSFGEKITEEECCYLIQHKIPFLLSTHYSNIKVAKADRMKMVDHCMKRGICRDPGVTDVMFNHGFNGKIIQKVYHSILKQKKRKCPNRGSNPGPRAHKTRALPTELFGR